MTDDSETDDPVRIPIVDDDSVEESTDDSRSAGLIMLVLAIVAFVVIYLVSRGNDDAMEPPF
ncbi:hypothetical protein GL213_12895 [Halogeometricum borinquense]|uniref:Uncharacterized protein n=1 Tax=Halogeometricum borinquense TaxID=60847 RepID=A0A6C0UHI0_9EURY|nr:hypothetical protein [Halogeometricum borinquense]QIB73259.1 hypothetical protein G3I44_02545 [Halogeometricum borinquense]QIQ77346.1 hypothetical protein GL213_12895 [Halogeometricum borinquense]